MRNIEEVKLERKDEHSFKYIINLYIKINKILTFSFRLTFIHFKCIIIIVSFLIHGYNIFVYSLRTIVLCINKLLGPSPFKISINKSKKINSEIIFLIIFVTMDVPFLKSFATIIYFNTLAYVPVPKNNAPQSNYQNTP